MWSIKKILVPTDFSKPSEAALGAAIGLARKFDASIVLVHAYHVPVYAYSIASGLAVDEFAAHVESGAKKALEAVAFAHRTDIPITTALYVGSPWEQILKAAKDHEVSLIIIGSRGLSGLPRALLGSTAERVVRYASVPVLAFHEPAATAAEAGAGDVNAAGKVGALGRG